MNWSVSIRVSKVTKPFFRMSLLSVGFGKKDMRNIFHFVWCVNIFTYNQNKIIYNIFLFISLSSCSGIFCIIASCDLTHLEIKDPITWRGDLPVANPVLYRVHSRKRISCHLLRRVLPHPCLVWISPEGGVALRCVTLNHLDACRQLCGTCYREAAGDTCIYTSTYRYEITSL